MKTQRIEYYLGAKEAAISPAAVSATGDGARPSKPQFGPPPRGFVLPPSFITAKLWKLIIGAARMPLRCLLLAATVTAAQADGMPEPAPAPRYAIHNGSLMQIIAGPNRQVRIIYVRPRLDLYGAAPGAVLIEGRWNGDRLEATAYGFAVCGVVPYPVAGSVNLDGILTLVGQAPVVDSISCALLGWQWNVSSTLSFVPIPGDAHAPPPPP